jgi:microcystin degradation protein MlrC
MQDEADVLVFFKEYPHTDYVECGEHLLNLLERTRRGQVRPLMRAFDCHMVAAMQTKQEPIRSYMTDVRSREAGAVLSISVVHGFARGDVPDVGAKVLVVTDNDAGLAARTAHELGQRLFSLREQLRTTRTSMADTLDLALADAARPQILLEVDDNPGAGAGGDNTDVLRLLLSRGVKEVCAGPLWDPLAVRFCFDAGVGARLQLRIGGKVGPGSGAPLDVRAEVLALQRNHHQRVGSFDAPLGDSAAVSFEGIELVLTSVRDQAYDPGLFSGLSIDCRARRFIVLKSAQQFRIGFDVVSTQVFAMRRPVTVDRGLKRIGRPLWPFVELTELPPA